MSTQDDNARVRASIEAHGLTPTDEEMAMYVALAPMLWGMAEQLHGIEIAEEL